MSCTAVPPGLERAFGHTCGHENYPHRIHVLVVKKRRYARLYAELAKRAE